MKTKQFNEMKQRRASAVSGKHNNRKESKNMKRYVLTNVLDVEDVEIVIGTAREIKTLERNLRKRVYEFRVCFYSRS